jgi:tRNA-specific 2-thiouridylase
MKKVETVAVGLSGGVDSSLAAALLKQAGYHVIGITMKIYSGAIKVQQSQKHACYGPGEEEDIALATQLCDKLDIPYHVFDLHTEYETYVLDYFTREYKRGRTPNPCVVCNHQLKFGFLVDRAKEHGLTFDYFATGHYARIIHQNNTPKLVKARDAAKDQTYFLSRLPREQLNTVLFPLGDLTKKEVRELARDHQLNVAERAESQDFIAGGDYSPLFNPEDKQPGDIVDTNGNVLGQHSGIINYTIGQRKGLGIQSEKPLYVSKIDAEKNQLVVSEVDGLFNTALTATEINWLGITPQDLPKSVRIKPRLTRQDVPGTASLIAQDMLRIDFDDPQRAISPGQIVALYENDQVLCSAIIEKPV